MGTIPTPPTFTAGAVLTATQLNTLRDVANFWALTPRCYAWQNTAQTGLTSATFTVIVLDSEVYDIVQSGDTASHDNTTNNSRIYARTAGKYEITGQIQFATNTSGYRQAEVRLNAAGNEATGARMTINAQGAVTTAGAITSVAITPFEAQLSAGDYIEMFGWQNSGGALQPFSGNTGYTFLRMKLTGT